MKNKKELEKSSLKDQLNSILVDMFPSEPTKTPLLDNQSPKNNSKPKSVELKDIDLCSFYLLHFSTSLYTSFNQTFNISTQIKKFIR